MSDRDSILEGIIFGAGIATVTFALIAAVFMVFRFAAATVVCT